MSVLDLADNNLTTVSGLPNTLTSLNLSYNNLSAFNGAGFADLAWLDLTNNALTSFTDIGFSSLQVLYLETNQITAFDSAGMPVIQELYLGDNQLNSFSLNNLAASLTTLDLSNNSITSFV